MDYRSVINRYSTGQGPSLSVDLPEDQTEFASFKMEPLETPYATPESMVDLVREADRVSMQVEGAAQQVRVFGYNTNASKLQNVLKTRLELLKHLLQNYPIKKVRYIDLQNLYQAYEKDTRSIDALVQKVLKYQKGRAAASYVEVAAKVRKGYPVYDQYGKIVPTTLGNQENKSLIPALVGLGTAIAVPITGYTLAKSGGLSAGLVLGPLAGFAVYKLVKNLGLGY